MKSKRSKEGDLSPFRRASLRQVLRQSTSTPTSPTATNAAPTPTHPQSATEPAATEVAMGPESPKKGSPQKVSASPTKAPIKSEEEEIASPLEKETASPLKPSEGTDETDAKTEDLPKGDVINHENDTTADAPKEAKEAEEAPSSAIDAADALSHQPDAMDTDAPIDNAKEEEIGTTEARATGTAEEKKLDDMTSTLSSAVDESKDIAPAATIPVSYQLQETTCVSMQKQWQMRDAHVCAYCADPREENDFCSHRGIRWFERNAKGEWRFTYLTMKEKLSGATVPPTERDFSARGHIDLEKADVDNAVFIDRKRHGELQCSVVRCRSSKRPYQICVAHGCLLCGAHQRLFRTCCVNGAQEFHTRATSRWLLCSDLMDPEDPVYQHFSNEGAAFQTLIDELEAVKASNPPTTIKDGKEREVSSNSNSSSSRSRKNSKKSNINDEIPPELLIDRRSTPKRKAATVAAASVTASVAAEAAAMKEMKRHDDTETDEDRPLLAAKRRRGDSKSDVQPDTITPKQIGITEQPDTKMAFSKDGKPSPEPAPDSNMIFTTPPPSNDTAQNASTAPQKDETTATESTSVSGMIFSPEEETIGTEQLPKEVVGEQRASKASPTATDARAVTAAETANAIFPLSPPAPDVPIDVKKVPQITLKLKETNKVVPDDKMDVDEPIKASAKENAKADGTPFEMSPPPRDLYLHIEAREKVSEKAQLSSPIPILMERVDDPSAAVAMEEDTTGKGKPQKMLGDRLVQVAGERNVKPMCYSGKREGIFPSESDSKNEMADRQMKVKEVIDMFGGRTRSKSTGLFAPWGPRPNYHLQVEKLSSSMQGALFDYMMDTCQTMLDLLPTSKGIMGMTDVTVDVALGGKPSETVPFQPLHTFGLPKVFHLLHTERHWTAGPFAYVIAKDETGKDADMEEAEKTEDKILSQSQLMQPSDADPSEDVKAKTRWPFGSEEPLHGLRRKVFNLSETPSLLDLQNASIKLASFFDPRRQQAFSKMISEAGEAFPKATVAESVTDEVWDQDTAAFGGPKLDALVWVMFPPSAANKLITFLKNHAPADKPALRRDNTQWKEVLDKNPTALLSPTFLDALQMSQGLTPVVMTQYEGDTVYIPQGWIAQATAYADCICLSAVVEEI